MAKQKSPAIAIAKNGTGLKLNKPQLLSTGIEVLLKPVPSAAVIEAQKAIKNPPIPRQSIEGKEGTFENLTDPDYIQKISEKNIERIEAQYDVMAMLGVELVNGLPKSDEWLEKLQFLTRLGRLDLDKYDLTSLLEKEFIYKRYVVMGNDDWTLLTNLSGLVAEDVEAAQDNFRGN